MSGFSCAARRVLIHLLIALMCVAVGKKAFSAEPGCIQYQAEYTGPGTAHGVKGPWVASFEASCASMPGLLGGNGFQITPGVCKITFPGNLSTTEIAVATRPCVPENCESYEGPSQFGFFVTGTGTQPNQTCHAPSGCVATKVQETCAGGSCMANYTLGFAGSPREQCAVGEAQIDEDVNVGEGEACVSGSTVEFCQSTPTEDNCGFVNGEFMCLGKVKQDDCAVGADGSRVCGQAAPTPPVPDNGTPGVKATPDDTLELTDAEDVTNNFNYYNSTTVAGSSRDAGADGDNPYDTGPEDEGENSGGGGGTGTNGTDDDGCTEEDGCTGALPAIGEEGDCENFAQCATSFYARVVASPILASVSEVGDSFPGGSCPSWDFEVFDQSVSLSAPMCSIWNSISGLLGGVCLVVFAWVSTRVVLSA